MDGDEDRPGPSCSRYFIQASKTQQHTLGAAQSYRQGKDELRPCRHSFPLSPQLDLIWTQSCLPTGTVLLTPDMTECGRVTCEAAGRNGRDSGHTGKGLVRGGVGWGGCEDGKGRKAKAEQTLHPQPSFSLTALV